MGGKGEKGIGWKEGMGWDVLKWGARSVAEKKGFFCCCEEAWGWMGRAGRVLDGRREWGGMCCSGEAGSITGKEMLSFVAVLQLCGQR